MSHKGRSQIANAGKRHMPYAGRSQNVFDMSAQAVHVITDAALSYLAEIGKVFTYLTGLYPKHLSHLKGRDDLAPLLFHQHQEAVVLYEPLYRWFRYFHYIVSSSILWERASPQTPNGPRELPLCV